LKYLFVVHGFTPLVSQVDKPGIQKHLSRTSAKSRPDQGL
jgi:hypothetical protein